MCGIVGVNFHPKVDFADIVKILSHRGPDFSGIKKIDNNYFGHTRLSIIDLNSEANQPMVFDNIVLSFNGEIYNYKNLIKTENLICQTSSDSEVIIRLYQKYQYEFLDKLNGAFSFCLYDIKQDIFFCARDRYGKKPFYYFAKDNKFIFSSMIKPIIEILGYIPKLNKIALSQYLQFFTPLTPNTFYQDILKLDKSSFLIYQNGKLQIKKYYKIKKYKKISDETTALQSIEKVLEDSINSRLVSDVEVGSLLSGGIDSSLISSLYTKISGHNIKTFSVGYEDYLKYSELSYANIVAKDIKSEHYPLVINQKDFIDSLHSVLQNLEEPHADPASIPLFLLTNLVKQVGIKTVLSGEGSDELFLGYDNYAKILKYYNFQNSLDTNQHSFLDNIIGALTTQTKESEYLRRVVKKENIYYSFGEIFTNIQKRKLFHKLPNFKFDTAQKDPVDWMSYIDLKIWLGEALLSKVDKMSMANSIEVRNPFLDFRLVDLVFSIKSDIKVGNTNKYLLKQIASKHIPQEIINRPKKGFNSPFNEWLFDYYGSYLLDLILEVNLQTNLFKNDYIKFLFQQAKNNKFKQHFYAIWLFSMWYKKTYL
jgi:asparagine synthase (glutamine-hydrolysing)